MLRAWWAVVLCSAAQASFFTAARDIEAIDGRARHQSRGVMRSRAGTL